MQILLDKYKHECADLRSRANETRLYKEREESFLIDIANLKNELK
jgi:hypothetical protein